MTELRTVQVQHKDVILEGKMALPEGAGPHPALMVAGTAQGRGERVFGVARKLAQLGYVAVAVDYYGGGLFHHAPMDAVVSMSTLYDTPGELRARMVSWFDALRLMPEINPNRIGAIGYCMGGEAVIELARSGVDLKAAVSFHGTLVTHQPAQPGEVKAFVVAYCGASDPYVLLETIAPFQDEMIAAGARWHTTVFGTAAHSFTDPDVINMPGLYYEPLADKLSWTGMRMILEDVV